MSVSLDLRKTFRQTAIICAAMTASVLLYLIIFEVLRRFLHPPSPPVPRFSTSPGLKILFYGGAIAIIILTRVLARGGQKSAPGEDPRAYIQKLARSSIVIAALSEVPALLGFFYSYVTGNFRAFYAFVFVSLGLEFIYFPRLIVWRDLVRSRYPSSLNEGGSDE